MGFNTQPHGGGCADQIYDGVEEYCVSTHSRTEAAAEAKNKKAQGILVSTHSRTEAAAFVKFLESKCYSVSTHSRTEAAAEAKNKKAQDILVSTHSRTEAAAFLLPKHSLF